MAAHGPEAASDWRQGLVLFYLTGSVCFLGAWLGNSNLGPSHFLGAPERDFFAITANHDGHWYVSILIDGYRYEPGQRSNVAFFPVFPLLGWATQQVTGLRSDVCLMLVANLFLAASFVVLLAYMRQRFPSEPVAMHGFAVLALGLYPPGLFMRMAYSESAFLFFAVVTLYALERGWPLWMAAVVAGAASGTRSVGICLTIPLALHVWRTSGSWRHALSQLWLAPIAAWGLLMFMAYQHHAFGDPLAFAKVQEAWRARSSESLATKAIDLLTLEPVWSVFDPSSPCCWRGESTEPSGLFSMDLANPLYWVAALALLSLGAWRRWLTAPEWTLGLALLLVPYVLRSHEMCMASMARFTSVAFPIYIVLGRLLFAMQPTVAAGWLSLAGFYLAVYAALFAAMHRVF